VPGILHVCRANLARSALAELATTTLLAQRGLDGVVPVSSAGTWTPGGQPIWPPAAQEALRRGWNPSAFVSRSINRAIINDADLVLAATRELRDEVLAQAPGALRRTFTWRELTWLLDGASADELASVWSEPDPGRRLRALADVARARRGLLVAPDGAEFDVRDPARASSENLPEVLSRGADQISHTIDVVMAAYLGPVS